MTAQSIALPQGAGAVGGLGESFSAQLSTGLVGFSVPIQLPAGRGAVRPNLNVQYSSAGGNGPLGMGWQLGVLSIERQFDRRLPKYDDRAAWHAEQDTFAFSGAGELVPICNVGGGSSSGTCDGALPGETMPTWASGWQYFRPRIENVFQRFFWSPDHRTWRVQAKSGIAMELGVPLDGTNDEGAIETNPRDRSKVFRWNVVRLYDALGANTVAPVTPVNPIVYRYWTPPGEAAAYLSDIFDTPPRGGALPSQWMHHTHLVWETRPDSSVSYRRGWETRQTQRLARIEVASKSFLGGPALPRELLRRYKFAYEGGITAVSLLRSIELEGRCPSPITEGQDETLPPPNPSCARLAPVVLSYHHVSADATGLGVAGDVPGFEAFDNTLRHMQASPPNSLDETLTDLFDVNSDGLPDVLVTAPAIFGGGHGVFFNGGGGAADTFAAATQMNMASTTQADDAIVRNTDTGSLTLRNPKVAPLDVDGDGTVDLLHMPEFDKYAVFAPRKVGASWVWQGRAANAAGTENPKINFQRDRDNTKVVDVNGDGLVDIVYSGATQLQTFFALGRYIGGDSQFGQAYSTTSGRTPSAELSHVPVTACAPFGAGPVRFGDSDVRLGDMNGDGLTDIVRIRQGDTRYWPGRGNGFWGTGETVDCPSGPNTEDRSVVMGALPSPPSFDDSQLIVDDVNGDGLSDLVQVRFGAVDIWLNQNGDAWAGRHVIAGQATSSVANRVRLVDINGSGTRDVVWGDGNDYRYVDLQAGARPWLLSSVSNGLGKTTDFEYATSTELMLADEAAGRPWTSHVPFPVHVVRRVVQDDHLDAVGRARGRYATEYSFRDPVWDGAQREFRGFGAATTRHIGDANSPTDFVETTFHLGECDNDPGDPIDRCSPQGRAWDNPREALKGQPAISETYDEMGRTLATTHNTYRLRTLYTGLDGRRSRQAYVSRSDTFRYDVGAPFSPRTSPPAVGVQVNELELESSLGGTMTTTTSSSPLRSSTGVAHTRSEIELDVFGNTRRSIDYGCVEGCEPDEVLSTTTVMDRPDGDPSGWIFRLKDTYASGADPSMRWHRTMSTFDANGFALRTDAEIQGTLPLDRRHEAFADVAPPPAAASTDGITTIVRYGYDPFGNITERKGANARCRSLAYDPDYAMFATVESIYVGNPAGECGSLKLTTTASYDLGLGLPTQVLGIHGEISLAEYDGLGRPVRFFRPLSNPSLIGNVASLPSVIIDYSPTTAPANQPYSSIHIQTQDGVDEGQASYRDTWTVLDGMGRTVVSFAQADLSAGDEGAWVASGATEYDAKGAVRRAHLPFFTDAKPNSNPLDAIANSRYQSIRYDAFGRAVQRFALDGALIEQVNYHAMSTDRWDAADLAAGPHQGTYATRTMDGHGRQVTDTERMHVGGSVQMFESRSSYTPTGELLAFERTHLGSSDPKVIRWMRHDSMGRVVLNVEPNTTTGFSADPSALPSSMHAWRYAYDDSGDLVGTSDARGCGTNLFYDAGGREVAEDFSPCMATQLPYSSPILGPDGEPTGNGTEAFTRYDSADPETDAATIAGLPPNQVPLRGRPISTSDRGSKTLLSYDARGRITGIGRKIAVPGRPSAVLSERYARAFYVKTAHYDALDRSVDESTGAVSPELAGKDGKSDLTVQYTKRGLTRAVAGSYGSIFAGSKVDAVGLVQEATYGDVAATKATYLYDERSRVQSVQTYRGPPPPWSATPSPGYPSPPTGSANTRQRLLEDREFVYDAVDNPIEIRDWRLPDEWPVSAKPVTRKIQYDDGYRVTRVEYEYAGGDDWTSPTDAEDGGDYGSQRARPSPHVAFDRRPQWQTFRYDWLGNIVDSRDDANAFYDRSLGSQSHDLPNGKPYQLTTATNLASTPTSASLRGGSLVTAFDAAGNMTGLAVRRDGPCLPAGSSCWQRFAYDWDEIGRLSRARRWDLFMGTERSIEYDLTTELPARAADADLEYAYNDADNRVLKSATDANGARRFAAYVFESLELRATGWDTEANDYVRTAATEVPRLVIAGARFGRVVFGETDMPTLSSGRQHVFLELTGHLGSTQEVIDRDSSELVEYSEYLAYGATESDFRAERWKNYRSDYHFTGKEEDIEVGLNYFGKRYYSPYLARWISPDPRSVHLVQGDPNLYAYVGGRTFAATDPNGEIAILAVMAIAALVAAAINVGSQMYSAGAYDWSVVNWGQVAVAAGIGGLSAGSGAVAASIATPILAGVMSEGAAVIVGDVVVGGAVGGATHGGLTRLSRGEGLGTGTQLLTDAAVGVASAGIATAGVAGGKALMSSLSGAAKEAAEGAAASGAASVGSSAANGEGGLVLEIRPKAGWSPEQLEAFNLKVDKLQQLAEDGKLIVTDVERDPSVTAEFRQEQTGSLVGKDADHIHDLRLGGADTKANMGMLDSSVNRSIGAQQGNQLRGVPAGTKVTKVNIQSAPKAPVPRVRVAVSTEAPTSPPSTPSAPRIRVDTSPRLRVDVAPPSAEPWLVDVDCIGAERTEEAVNKCYLK